MYGQGNYGPQAGQVSYTSVPPQCSAVPVNYLPPPPPPSQHAHSVSRPPIMQSCPQSVEAQVVCSNPLVYQHIHPGVPQNFPRSQAPTGGISSSQSCLMPTVPNPPPPVQVHQSAPMHTSYQTAQWNSQWRPTAHHILPAMSPGAPRVFPPPPPQTQTQTPFGGSVHMSLPVPGVQPIPQSLPPPAPPAPNTMASISTPTEKSCNLVNQLGRGSTIDGTAFSSRDNHLASVCVDACTQKEDGGTGSAIGSSLSENLNLDIPASSPKPLDRETQQSSDIQGNNNSSMRAPATHSSLQSIDSVDAGVSYSPTNSDMEMEDDITQPDEEQKVHSFGTLNLECVSITNKLDLEEQSQGAVSTAECGLVEDVVEEERQGLCGSSYLSHSVVNKSSPRLKLSAMSPFQDVAEVQHSSLVHENSCQSNPGIVSEKCPAHPAEGPSPFSLIQGYASDDSLENNNNDDDGIRVENASLAIGSGSTEVRTIPSEDAGRSLECSPVSQRVVSETDRTSNVAEKSTDASSDTADEERIQKNALRDDNTNTAFDISNLPREDVKNTSGVLKIDEFGRLAREGSSDSDSGDSPRYTRRRGKREKSWSRSRSPYDRRRWSPRRRKDKRGRSRSVSPKRRRSRSKSPFRHGFGGDKVTRGKFHPSECFDFKRGKCYRGASCRYSHHESDKSDRSRSYRSKDQHRVRLPSSRNPGLHEETGTALLDKTIHENNKTKSPEIHDIGEKRERELEPLSHLHGKESCTEPSASPVTHVKPNKHSDYAAAVPSSVETAVILQSQSQNSDQTHHGAVYEPKLLANSSVSESSTLQASTSIQLQHLQFPGPKELSAPNVPVPSCFPPFPALSCAPSATSAQQLLGQYKIMPQFNLACIENRPPCQPPLPPQQSHFPAPVNISWNSLPPTMPPLNPPHLSFVNNAIGNTSLGQYGATPGQFQQSILLPRNDFVSQNSVRPYQNALPSISQVGQHQAYMHTQPISSMGSPIKKAQTLPVDSLPPSELPHPSSKSYPYMHQLPCVPNHSEAAFASVYTSDLLDRNREPGLSGFGGSKISSYFNPYASKFEQSLTSKISSDAPTEGKRMLSSDRNCASFSLHNVPDGRPAESLGSHNTPPHSASAANRMLCMPGGDQYDPLLDSIEPSTNSFRKSDPVQKRETTADSGVMLRLSGWSNPLDVEENNMQKRGGTITKAASAGNDEYGETADAEVGVVEDGSPSDSNDVEDMVEGEVEFDQVKTSGKKNKSKESRSSRLFKNGIADFVKELLKPSWRQGNMSKEVFKTIVKKTVEKVSGAMKSHKIPKSPAKINRYIDSSQRKLTKLVMGYVDKYVKV
ncbi:PREDICTED: serine/arginine repetitive matrix protein 2-like isoform X2 [Ipomoea nil]|uniref:serine/arginine repetitive matrix protein 2-like isoform X2 n=1 Tax=Ipomoea nil TaxID=35883 RepID=UPI000900A0F1|nr:PREDICTED: serine/arginine repetitive matrix protein 2-like isoform X2 [Ipomoea nil]